MKEIQPFINLWKRDRKRVMALGLTALAISSSVGPLLVAHFGRLWRLPHYQSFPLILIAAALLFRRRLVHVLDLPPNSSPSSKQKTQIGLCVALTLVTVAVFFGSPWMGMASSLVLAWALLRHLLEGRATRSLLPIFAFCAVLLPLPFGIDSAFIRGMQGLLVQLTSPVLDLLRIDHLVLKNIIQLPDRSLLIEEACSGSHSLFTLFGGAWAFSLWQGYSVIRGFSLTVMGVGWAILSNVLRILIIACAASWGGIDLTSGLRHEVLGLFTFCCTLLLVWSTDALIAFIHSFLIDFYFDEEEKKTPARTAPPLLPRLFRNTIPNWVMGTLAAIACFQFGLVAYQTYRLSSIQTRKLASVEKRKLKEADLPIFLQGSRRRGMNEIHRAYTHTNGEYSSLWKYESEGQPYAISFDYPFWGWHELADCYQAVGWRLASEEIQAPPKQFDSDGEYHTLDLNHPGHRYGWVVFGIFDGYGRAVGNGAALTSRVFFRLTPAFLEREVSAETQRTYQIQLFEESATPLGRERRDLAVQRFLEARSLLLKELGRR